MISESLPERARGRVELRGGRCRAVTAAADDLIEQGDRGRLLFPTLPRGDLAREQEHLEPATLQRKPGGRATQCGYARDRVSARQREQRRAQIRTCLFLNAL